MSLDPIRDSALAIARAVNVGDVSAAEIAETMIPHVERVDARLDAYLCLTPELMREQARRVDRRAPKPAYVGSLCLVRPMIRGGPPVCS